jgi:hypothetical protein
MHSRVGVVEREHIARSIGGGCVSIGPTGLGDSQHSPHETESGRHVNAGYEMREREMGHGENAK